MEIKVWVAVSATTDEIKLFSNQMGCIKWLTKGNNYRYSDSNEEITITIDNKLVGKIYQRTL